MRELIGRQARSASASGSASSSASGSASSSASPTSTGDAELVVSELVTNALRHGEGAIELRLALIEPERLVVEVVDEGDAADEVRRRAPDGAAPARERQGEAPGGWGLQIVDAVASRWGVFEGTTHVWAELSLGAP